jgi:DnaJ-domain-containing protein 1
MTDYFALLKQQRRPWVDPELLKEQFLALSAEVHPDRVHNASAQDKLATQEQYTLLNSAYTCLRDPKARLLHLLELERGYTPQQVQTIPPALMDLFMEVGQVCRLAEAVSAQKSQAVSPLLQVQLFEGAQESIDQISALQERLTARYDSLIAELKAIGEHWPSGMADEAREEVLARLEELYRLFGFFARWRAQLDERKLQLIF